MLSICFLFVATIVQGFRDLVWLPIEQYRKDGRIVRGFQRGTASFGTSTAMAALELTNRMVRTIQVNPDLCCFLLVCDFLGRLWQCVNQHMTMEDEHRYIYHTDHIKLNLLCFV